MCVIYIVFLKGKSLQKNICNNFGIKKLNLLKSIFSHSARGPNNSISDPKVIGVEGKITLSMILYKLWQVFCVRVLILEM